MITKIWLKGKTKGEDAIEYPDCYLQVYVYDSVINIKKYPDGNIEANYLIINVARIEFRP